MPANPAVLVLAMVAAALVLGLTGLSVMLASGLLGAAGSAGTVLAYQTVRAGGRGRR